LPENGFSGSSPRAAQNGVSLDFVAMSEYHQ
jgi:hypothetical protein